MNYTKEAAKSHIRRIGELKKAVGVGGYLSYTDAVAVIGYLDKYQREISTCVQRWGEIMATIDEEVE